MLLLLDSAFSPIRVFDEFESLVWSERYDLAGDFELYLAELVDYRYEINEGLYLVSDFSDRMMIVESYELYENPDETGFQVVLKGPSVESFLSRRIVWRQTLLKGNFQNAIKRLLDQNAISPTDSERTIPGLSFKASVDPDVVASTLETQLTGDNLYTAIADLCYEQNLGFRVLPTASNGFEFELYLGVDRTFAQEVYPYVVFSEDFENLVSAKYSRSVEGETNVARIGGEGEGRDRRFQTIGSGVGLSRRELFVDARDISSTNPEGGKETIPEADYNEQLRQRGREKMAETTGKDVFEASISTNSSVRYPRDFGLGDLVQIVTPAGFDLEAMVTEVIFSFDSNGPVVTPTFEIV